MRAVSTAKPVRAKVRVGRWAACQSASDQGRREDQRRLLGQHRDAEAEPGEHVLAEVVLAVEREHEGPDQPGQRDVVQQDLAAPVQRQRVEGPDRDGGERPAAGQLQAAAQHVEQHGRGQHVPDGDDAAGHQLGGAEHEVRQPGEGGQLHPARRAGGRTSTCTARGCRAPAGPTPGRRRCPRRRRTRASRRCWPGRRRRRRAAGRRPRRGAPSGTGPGRAGRGGAGAGRGARAATGRGRGCCRGWCRGTAGRGRPRGPGPRGPRSPAARGWGRSRGHLVTLAGGEVLAGGELLELLLHGATGRRRCRGCAG